MSEQAAGYEQYKVAYSRHGWRVGDPRQIRRFVKQNGREPQAGDLAVTDGWFMAQELPRWLNHLGSSGALENVHAISRAEYQAGSWVRDD
jgi:hypothetical protein